jgi:hypothetical protein
MKEKLQLIKYFFIDTFGWCRSLWLFLFRSIRKPAVFYGYNSYFWACKYAQKRTDKWKARWNQAGKKQGVFPLNDTHLYVCSAAELKLLKKRNIVNKKLNPRKAIKKSYFTTKL